MSVDRFLIVDDEQPVREMIARMVTTEGRTGVPDGGRRRQSTGASRAPGLLDRHLRREHAR